MTQYLPSNLLALFAPRDPIPFLPPVDKLPYEKRSTGYSGIAQYVLQFEDPAVNPVPKVETKEEKREMKRRMKAEQVAYKLEQDIALWDPQHNPCATGNPYNTLFVARINYETTENNLLRNFGVYGPIRKIVLVKNNVTGQPRGYAFIEYEHEKDMHTAYKHADGKKLDSRRVLVDMERGRTIKGWLPRRLGGGIGGTRRGGPDVNVKHSSREQFLPDRHIGGGGGGGGGMKERTMDRDRDRSERRRSRSRERRRRSRSRSRDRHRSDRRSKRDRSRERRDRSDRGGDRDAPKADPAAADGVEGNGPEGVGAEPPAPSSRRERRRSRSRDRKHRRSRSRDRKRRSDHGDRGDRGERGGDRDRGDRESRRERRSVAGDASQLPPITIKQEPIDEDEVSRPANDEESVSQQDQPSMDGFNSSNYEGEYNYNNNGEANEYEGY